MNAKRGSGAAKNKQRRGQGHVRGRGRVNKSIARRLGTPAPRSYPPDSLLHVQVNLQGHNPNMSRSISLQPSNDSQPNRHVENLIVKVHLPQQDTSHRCPDRPTATVAPQSHNSSADMRSNSLDSQIESQNYEESCDTGNSFVEIARGRKLIGLMDRNKVDGHISRDRWDWIRASVAEVTLEVLREHPGPPPFCIDAGWLQANVKLIACDNDRSTLLYKMAVVKIGKSFPDMQLEVVAIDEIPSKPWATAWLERLPSGSGPMDILSLISTSNPDLEMSDWKVIKANKYEGTKMRVIFLINNVAIDYLIKSEGKLQYGFGNIHMNFYRTPQDALSNLEALSAAVDAPYEQDELAANETILDEDISGYLSTASDKD